jgi:hypothetical protein
MGVISKHASFSGLTISGVGGLVTPDLSFVMVRDEVAGLQIGVNERSLNGAMVTNEVTGDDGWQTQFLTELAARGNISESAKVAGITRQHAHRWYREHKEFATQWDEAIEVANDALEREAWRRAVEGVDEPVFFQGSQCGEIRKYSDQLLTTLLKANRASKFRDNSKVEVTGKDGAPFVIKMLGGEASMSDI